MKDNIDNVIEDVMNEGSLLKEFSRLLTVDNVPEAVTLFAVALKELGYSDTSDKVMDAKFTAQDERSKLNF